MGHDRLLEITSVSSWNENCRAARSQGHTVIVDFHAQWCGPCKQIAPLYAKLAAKYPFTWFLRVDVDAPGTKAIAAKYQISAMPTFIVIKPGDPSAKTGEMVEMLKGADSEGLNRMVANHASHAYNPPSTLSSDEAEQLKKDANAAFGSGHYKQAVELYTKALAICPRSVVLYSNRSFAYARIARSQEASLGERSKARASALQDALYLTQLEERWGKGWIRLLEAMLLSNDKESMDQYPSDEIRKEGLVKMLEGAEEAIGNAVRLSEGNIKIDAEQKLAQIRADLAKARLAKAGD